MAGDPPISSQNLTHRQDMDINGASSNSSSSLSISHVCLMAKASKVSSTLNPNVSHDDDDDEENDNDDSIHEKGQLVLRALSNNKFASSKLFEIMGTLVAHEETIEAMETSLDKCHSLELEYVDEIEELKGALEEEQETRVSLEEKLESIEESHNEIISKLIKERDHVIAKNKVLKKEKVEFGVGHAKLIEDIE